jgi:hypothetical protein
LEERKQKASVSVDADSVRQGFPEDKKTLRLPDFVHLQDFVNPVFERELILASFECKGADSEGVNRVSFSKSDQEVLE